MASVFIAGAGGAGKTTLIDHFIRESGSSATVIKEIARTHMVSNDIRKEDLRNKETSWKLQCDIVQIQLRREMELEGSHFISDRSALDPLVYAAIIKPNMLPLLKNEEPNWYSGASYTLCEEMFAPLLDDGGDAWREDVNAMVRRYRSSLFVLVHPFGDVVEDDGVRTIMNRDELDRYTNLYRSALHILGIPFIDLREKELSARVHVLQRAISECILPSPLETLSHYANISSKKPDREAIIRHYRDVNLPFYATEAGGTLSGNEHIRCLSLSGSELRQSFVSYQPGKTSRFVERYGTRRIFLLEFEPEVPSFTVQKLLGDGIKIQGRQYSFLGCSSSGLKKRKCYLLEGTNADAEAVREENGDFSSIASVSKRIARFSLLLSNVVPTRVVPSNVVPEPDVEHEGGANFTDGCGSVSPDLAESLFQQTRKTLKWNSDQIVRPPSAFQVRFQGYKGVLAVNSQLKHSTIVVRPSMKKFATESFPNLYVCDYSRPFSFGHLNRQFIVLLSGLGVPDSVFEDIQNEHFRRVSRMLYDHDAALMLLEWRNRASELACEILDEDADLDESNEVDVQDSVRPQYLHLRPLQQRLIAESPKLRILVPESRNIFGVAEPPRFCSRTGKRLPGVLRSGECFVRLSVHGKYPKSLQQWVVVSKNPCYLLGDVRVLQAVSEEHRPALREISRDLVDVIVFPIEGSRPHSNEIAGSDLDGDQYFVCWDERLVPPRVAAPYDYPAFNSADNRSARQHENQSSELVKYFSIQHSVSRNTGRVDSLFRAWSNLNGADCSECEILGQLFSRVVDSAKSGERVSIPRDLVIPWDQRILPTVESKYVWQRMEFAAQAFVSEQQELQLASGTIVALTRELTSLGSDIFHENDDNDALDEVDEDSFLLDLVSRNHLVMSEFTKFRLVMDYFNNDVQSFLRSAFLHHVNFGLLSSEEREVAADRYRVPRPLLDNALRCCSRIIGFRLEFLRKYLLAAKVPWRFYWQTGKDEAIASFPDRLTHALRGNTDVLLLFQLPDAVVIILRFLRDVMKREESDALLTMDGATKSGCMRKAISGFIKIHAYFVSGHFGFHEKYSLEDPSYKMDLSDDGLQLYRGEHGQTFINLKVVSLFGGRKAKVKKKSKGDYKSRSAPTEDSIPLLEMSVDLTRFNRRILTGNRPHPLVRKTPIYEMEMFVHNRRTNFSDLPHPRKASYLDILSKD